MQHSMHEAIQCNYKTAGVHYCACLHLVAMKCCGHAEIVYACIPMDREESNERKYKRIIMAQ